MNERMTVMEELRKAWRDYWRGYREHTSSPNWPNNGDYPPRPPALASLTCGAKTRAGTPCKRIDLYWSGRCRLHGGQSTGPVTDEGKAKARENGKLGGRGRVRKPKPVETATKRPCSRSSPTESGNPSLEPKPMETLRYSQGSSLRAEELTKPDPMDREITAMVLPPKNLANFDIQSADSGKVTVWVHCRDCANLSAGYKCLVPATGQTFPSMGQPRGCVYFVSDYVPLRHPD
jgi:hypothetical protein